MPDRNAFTADRCGVAPRALALVVAMKSSAESAGTGERTEPQDAACEARWREDRAEWPGEEREALAWSSDRGA